MQTSSRNRAISWPYPRHEDFESELRGRAAAFFRARGYPVRKKYPFILADWEQWPSNIILGNVAAYVRREKEHRAEQGIGFPLHHYLHHGLSSQAMLFNLVGPLVLENDFEPIRSVLAAKGTAWGGDVVSARFEIEDRTVFNEAYGQPTSVDVVVSDGTSSDLFVEAKFVEREFGGCSVFKRGDCDGRNPSERFSLCYLHHIGRTYWPLLQSHGILTPAWSASPVCPLSVYYQFFREVLFALHRNGLFVLLHDERNPTFCCSGPDGDRGLFPFLVAMLPPEIRSRVISISVQDVFQAVVTGSGRDGRHKDWTGAFAEKYGMPLPGTTKTT